MYVPQSLRPALLLPVVYLSSYTCWKYTLGLHTKIVKYVTTFIVKLTYVYISINFEQSLVKDLKNSSVFLSYTHEQTCSMNTPRVGW